MKSIKKDIVRAITIILSAILFTLFLTIDIILDGWVKDKFDEALITKSSYLKTLIQENQNGVEFNFSGEFMPEFERENNAQYFQVWVNNSVFERSDSLDTYPEIQLVKEPLNINASKLIDVILPDGRQGRAMINYFYPQVPSRSRELITSNHNAVYLTIAVSIENFSYTLIAVDIIFWLLFFTLIIGMRYLVIYQIDKGLKPLSLLNEEIAHLKVDKSTSSLSNMTDEYIEIGPIRAELSKFIEFSQQTLKEEQRLSADIAHELKTPISEIISLSEMCLQYPNDLRISETYAEDMLSIALRMKSIVSNLMMINQSDAYLLKQQNEDIILIKSVNEVFKTLQSTYSNIFERIKIRNSLTNTAVNVDTISFSIIISNLIHNALFHSEANSLIILSIENTAQEGIQISIQNILKSPITEEQLGQIFKPLYQIDTARTDNLHFGLGLAIIEKLCVINNYTIRVQQPEKHKIKFTLLLNKFKKSNNPSTNKNLI